jgi:hypothetical protein
MLILQISMDHELTETVPWLSFIAGVRGWEAGLRRQFDAD